MSYFNLSELYADRDQTAGFGSRTAASALEQSLTALAFDDLRAPAHQYGLPAPETRSQAPLVQEHTTVMLAQMAGQDTPEGGLPHA